MTFRAGLIAALVLSLTLTAGCSEPERSADPHDDKPAATPARQAQPPADVQQDPVPGQQPPPPPADPGPYNDIHQVVVRVWWTDERSGFVTVLLNGTKFSHEAAGTSAKGADGKFHGGYLKTVPGLASGDVIEVQWNANGAPSWVMLAIYHNGKTIGSVQMGQPNCRTGQKLCIASGTIV